MPRCCPTAGSNGRRSHSFSKRASPRDTSTSRPATTPWTARRTQTAWKHHPWDANATGEAKGCKGIQTYVFKGGVVYRGALKATESGAPDNPIRLTRDPGWGQGAAAFYGSTQIKGGWKKANAEEAPGIPQPDKVWYMDLGKNYDPDPQGDKFSAMWQVDGDKVERLHIAREPNYDLSDPNNPVKNWPVWTTYDRKTSTLTSPVLKGLGDKNLFNGAVLWTERRLSDGGCHDEPHGAMLLRPRAGSLSGKELAPAWIRPHSPRQGSLHDRERGEVSRRSGRVLLRRKWP